MKLKSLLFAIAQMTLLGYCQASKILAFYPFPVMSHHKIVEPILFELAERGHQIDYYSALPMENPHRNVTLFKTKDFIRDMHRDLGEEKVTDELTLTAIGMGLHNLEFKRLILKYTCKIDDIVRLIRSVDKSYDLVLHESFFHQEFAGILAHKFQALSVNFLSSADSPSINEFSALPDNPSYMVSRQSTAFAPRTFFERLHNAYLTFVDVVSLYYSLYSIQPAVDECFRYPGWESRPSLFELASDNALILTNTHHSIGFAYPRPPHYKEIGGVHIRPPKPLPEDLEQIMNESKHGVVYFSLGSFFDASSMLDSSFRDMLSNAFGRLNETVLWKTNEKPRDDLPKNVKQFKWFPQQDLLAHKNMKLFISHGGLLSCFETAYNAVPVLLIPLFAEQARNAAVMTKHGVGETIKLEDVTEEVLYQKIRAVIDNDKYKKATIKRSEILKDRPMEPVKEGVYWIEYVLKHGRVLQPAGVKLSFFQLHLIDVYTAILGALALVYYALRRLVKSFTSTTKSVSRNKKRQ